MAFDTLISFTSLEMSVSNPRKTCKEASKSSIIPILALTNPRKIKMEGEQKTKKQNVGSTEMIMLESN